MLRSVRQLVRSNEVASVCWPSLMKMNQLVMEDLPPTPDAYCVDMISNKCGYVYVPVRRIPEIDVNMNLNSKFKIKFKF